MDYEFVTKAFFVICIMQFVLMSQSRQLAAIMSTHIVGYTQLMGGEEIVE